MSTHKNIDRICVAVVILSLLITVLFMNAERLGLSVIVSEDHETGMFTKNDLLYNWDTAGATEITLNGEKATVSGNGAYVSGGDVYIVGAGKYIISGSLENGSIIIDANKSDKIWLLFNGVSISCEDNAVLLVEQAKKVFLTLADGTENYLSCGTGQSDTIDGVIYSHDDLTINGSGALSVSANYKHAIVCNDDLVISGGILAIDAQKDGIHANDSVRICNADLTINAVDDGITVSNDDESALLYVESGTINIPACYEGLEAVYVTIAGGDIHIQATDDGINGNSDKNSCVKIDGGSITIINETGRDADGIDSNKDIEINGGTILISLNDEGSNCALDYGSENGGKCTINGGTIIACGGSSMLEAVSSESAQGFIMKTVSRCEAGTSVALADNNNHILITESIPCTFSSVIISCDGLKVGDLCTLTVGNSSEAITIDNSSVASGGMDKGQFGGKVQGNNPFENGGFERQPGENNGQPDEQMPNAPNMPDGPIEMPDKDRAERQNPDIFGENQADAQNFDRNQKSDDENKPGQNKGFTDEKERGEFGDANSRQEINEGWNMSEPIIWVGISFIILVIGLLIAMFYKKRI